MTPELLFGSQVWAPASLPAIAYQQTMSPIGRLLNPMSPPNPNQQVPGFGSGQPAPIPGVMNPLPFGEANGGITATALLAAVAIRRGQPLGPTTDQEIEDFIGDALDVLPGSGEIEVRCEGGRVTLAGQASHKRLKRDAGELAWAIPSVNDVQNNINVVARRRSRPGREGEAPAPVRKQA